MESELNWGTIRSFRERTDKLENEIGEIISELKLCDSVNNYPQYAELVMRYKQTTRELRNIVGQIDKSGREFLSRYDKHHTSEAVMNVVDSSFKIEITNIVAEDIISMAERYKNATLEYSRIKEEQDNRLKKYIIDLMKRNPGYIIAKRGCFYTSDKEMAEELKKKKQTKGFKSIKINSLDVVYKQKIMAIPAFMVELSHKNIIDISIQNPRLREYPYRVEDSQIHFISSAIPDLEEGKCIRPRKMKVACIAESNDSKYDKLGTFTIPSNIDGYEDIKIETTPRALAMLGLWFGDLGFEEYPYVIKLPDILKKLEQKSPKLVPGFVKKHYTRQSIPEKTSPDEERIYL